MGNRVTTTARNPPDRSIHRDDESPLSDDNSTGLFRSNQSPSSNTAVGPLPQQQEPSHSPTHARNGRGTRGSDLEDDRQIPPMDEYEEQESHRPAEMSWYQMAKAGYQELVNAIIRPPRAEYDIEALGPPEFEFVGKMFKRHDFQLRNERGYILECSHWQPHGWRVTDRAPCIIYMHGNSSARVEAIPQMSLALSLGATLVAFDFAGSGLSEGEYVSLGYYERDDVKAVIEHLRRSGTVGAIALWGRSMGAATALLHGDRDMSIAALVLDSTFADLTQLAEEMVERGREAGLTVPSFVVKVVLRMIRGSVSRTAGFNVRDLCPIAHADRTFIPALFVAGRNDDFIRPHHSQQIHDLYAGDKNIVLVEGDHNSPRPSFLYDSVFIFLQTYLQVPMEWGLDRANIPMGYPPWYGSAAASAFAARYASRGGGGSGSPEADEFPDYMAWDGDIEALRAMAAAGEDGRVDGMNGLGMTGARQAEFQNALFHMLAQERNAPAACEQDPGQGGEEAESSLLHLSRSAAATPAPMNRCGDDSHVYRKADGDAGGGRYTVNPMHRRRDEDGGEDGDDGVREGTVAVRAVAAAAAANAVISRRGGSAAGATISPEKPEYTTPKSMPRPVLAPYSVSDTASIPPSSLSATPDSSKRAMWRGETSVHSRAGTESMVEDEHGDRGSFGIIGIGMDGMAGKMSMRPALGPDGGEGEGGGGGAVLRTSLLSLDANDSFHPVEAGMEEFGPGSVPSGRANHRPAGSLTESMEGSEVFHSCTGDVAGEQGQNEDMCRIFRDGSKSPEGPIFRGDVESASRGDGGGIFRNENGREGNERGGRIFRSGVQERCGGARPRAGTTGTGDIRTQRGRSLYDQFRIFRRSESDAEESGTGKRGRGRRGGGSGGIFGNARGSVEGAGKSGGDGGPDGGAGAHGRNVSHGGGIHAAGGFGAGADRGNARFGGGGAVPVSNGGDVQPGSADLFSDGGRVQAPTSNVRLLPDRVGEGVGDGGAVSGGDDGAGGGALAAVRSGVASSGTLPAPAAVTSEAGAEWSCARCTLINESSARYCEVCGLLRAIC